MPLKRMLLVTVAVVLAGCESGAVCREDDPAALHFVVTDAVSGARLNGISGTVTSDGVSRAIGCSTASGQEECYGWASGTTASVHIEHAGSQPVDITNVAITRAGACNAPVLRDLEVSLHATGG